MKAFDLLPTRFGFSWGPALVERTCDDPRWGIILSIKGMREVAEIRVTPSGLIRFDKRKATEHDKGDVSLAKGAR